MSEPPAIAILGIFRSGTNYLRSLLELNYNTQAIYNAYGWKHGFIPIVTKENPLGYPRLPTLVLTRNPFSAIDALYRYAASTSANIDCHAQWPEFLRRRLVVYDKWNSESPQLWFPNPVHYWTAMNWNYLSAVGIYHVQYERLLADPRAECERIAATFNLPPRHSPNGFVDIDRRVKNMSDRERVHQHNYMTAQQFNNRSYYLSHAYIGQFTGEDRIFVRGLLDDTLLERMGYTKLVDTLVNGQPTSA